MKNATYHIQFSICIFIYFSKLLICHNIIHHIFYKSNYISITIFFLFFFHFPIVRSRYCKWNWMLLNQGQWHFHIKKSFFFIIIFSFILFLSKKKFLRWWYNGFLFVIKMYQLSNIVALQKRVLRYKIHTDQYLYGKRLLCYFFNKLFVNFMLFNLWSVWIGRWQNFDLLETVLEQEKSHKIRKS